MSILSSLAAIFKPRFVASPVSDTRTRVRLLSPIYENGRVKVTNVKGVPVAFNKGEIFEMSAASAAKYVQSGKAEYTNQ